MIFQENYSLKHLNTFGIEAKAKFFIELNSEIELTYFIKTELYKFKNVLILGSGSNILFTKDYDGLVIKYSAKGIDILSEDENEIIINASAGEIWDNLVNYCVKNNYYGIENLSLIPGTVGAAPIQNIGAYGVELKDCLDSLEGYSLNNGDKKVFNKDECRFGYRDSIFKSEYKNKILITSVILKLSKKKSFNLTYQGLAAELKNINENEITIELVSEIIKKIRRSKLPDTNILGNSGSFFKNPEISKEQFLSLHQKNPDLVFYRTIDNKYKIPAAWLIEKCGYKGKRIGNVGTYEKQALVIVNYGNSKGSEIKEFADKILDDVSKKFGINLEYEVNII